MKKLNEKQNALIYIVYAFNVARRNTLIYIRMILASDRLTIDLMRVIFIFKYYGRILLLKLKW